jgi:hypothetical protein
MAAQTCAVAQTATLSTTVADTITFTGKGNNLIVTNHDGTNNLFFRVDGTTAVGSADDNYVVRPGQTLVLPGVFGGTLVSVVGNGNVYTVAIF